MTEFLQNNWFWLVLALFIGMHFFGGGCGMGHRRTKADSDQGSKAGERKGCH